MANIMFESWAGAMSIWGFTTQNSGAFADGYDAEKDRVWKKVTRNGSVAEHMVFVYSGANCIAEYPVGAAPASPDQEYVCADGIDSWVMFVRNGGNQKLTVARNQLGISS